VLRGVKIQNFRCFVGLAVELRPLTVLIGPNDSGKSAFLAAVEHVLRATSKFEPADFWRHDVGNQIELLGDTDDGQIVSKSTPAASNHLLRETEENKQIRSRLLPVQKFHLPTAGIAMECQGYSPKEESNLVIGENGDRIPALLDHLLRRDRKRFFQIVDVLKKNIRGLEDIEIGTPNAHTRRVDLVTEGGFRVNAGQASAGVRLLLFFVALAYHPHPPRTILLEEPENGIHPKRLADVLELLHAVTTGKLGGTPAQVIVTTHSPYLLDSVREGEDQVLVFQRQADGSRTAKPIDTDRLRAFLDEFKLGEVWFNEEEAGLVAKS
jgi:predicted ATPase